MLFGSPKSYLAMNRLIFLSLHIFILIFDKFAYIIHLHSYAIINYYRNQRKTLNHCVFSIFMWAVPSYAIIYDYRNPRKTLNPYIFSIHMWVVPSYELIYDYRNPRKTLNPYIFSIHMWVVPSYVIIYDYRNPRKTLNPYIFSIRTCVCVVPISPVWSSKVMSIVAFWCYVFTYHIGRALYKECLTSDESTHSTIQRHIVVEMRDYICLERNISHISFKVCNPLPPPPPPLPHHHHHTHTHTHTTPTPTPYHITRYRCQKANPSITKKMTGGQPPDLSQTFFHVTWHAI